MDLKPEDCVHVFNVNKEGQLFIDEYSRMIDSKHIKYENEITPLKELKNDKYLYSILHLRKYGGSEIEYGHVKQRVVDLAGKPIGV